MSDKAINASAVQHLNLDHLLDVFAFVILQHRIGVHSGIKDGVVCIRPKGKHLICGKAFETKLTAVVIWIEPAFAADNRTLTNIAEGTAKTLPKNGAKRLRILFVVRVKGERAPKGVVGFLVNHFGV